MGESEDAQHATRALTALVGRSLHLLGVGGWQVSLELGGDHAVTLEQAVDVGDHQPAAEPATLNGLALLLPLLNREVTAAYVEADGRLVLSFGDLTLQCAPDAEYEAWNYRGPSGALIICQPGGGLAVWMSG